MTYDRNKIELRYGDGSVTVALPNGKTADVFLPNDLPGAPDGVAEVRRAMAEPIGAEPLERIARDKRRPVIIVDDATRPVPNKQMLVPILESLRRAGLRDEQTTVVVATGIHRLADGPECRRLTGNLPVRVISHDPHNDDELVTVGTTSRGCELRINRTVAEADLRILTGDVELHQFVGYGGGAKSVMPGVADPGVVNHTHSRMMSPGTGPGRFDGNPVRAEVEEAADILGVHFIVNVALNSRHEIVGAFAGDVHEAFLAGTKLVDRMYKVPASHRYDAVLASAGGSPKDIDLYQSQKAITSARRLARRGGRVIVAAECREGHGSELAHEWAREAETPEDIVRRFEQGFVMGGHKAFQLARDAQWADVHLLSAMPAATAEAFFLKPIEDAGRITALLEDAESIAVLPQATLTLPVLPGQDNVDF